MIKIFALLIATASCLMIVGSAEARETHPHRQYWRHHARHHAWHHVRYRRHLAFNSLGDQLLSGRSGMHRSVETQVMVPDVRDGDPDDAGEIGANGSVGLHKTGR
jgi:hypothetical protein